MSKKSSPRSVTDAEALRMANDTVADFLSGKRQLTSSLGLPSYSTQKSKKSSKSSKPEVAPAVSAPAVSAPAVSAPAVSALAVAPVSKDSGSGEEKKTSSTAAPTPEEGDTAPERLSWRKSKLKPLWKEKQEKQDALLEQMRHRDRMTPGELMLKRTPKYHASLSSRFPSISSLPYPKNKGGRKTKRKRRRKHKLRTKRRKLHKKTRRKHRRKHRRKSHKKRKSRKR